MNKLSSNNILEFNEPLSSNKSDVPQSMTLPYPLNLLIICSNISIEEGLNGYFSSVSKIEITYCTSLPQNINNFNLVLLIVDDNTHLIKRSIEQLFSMNINFLLLGDNIERELIRTAIHFKVRDIISISDIEKELYSSLLNVANELLSSCNIAPLFTIINGKSGSGASFITSCLGEMSANISAEEIAIIDTDLNYGTLTDTFNFEPNYYITDALEELEQLDNVAIKSMMIKRDNLNFLASKPYTLLNTNASILEELPKLMWKIKFNHDLVLLDLSRGLERHAIPLVELSDKIIIIVQQNILNLRETKVLIQQLIVNVGIPIEKLHVIVNRFSNKDNNISVKDIKKVLDIESVFIVSNNYELANAGINSGSPILKVENHKVIQREVCHIIKELFPIDVPDDKPSIFQKLFRRQ